MAIDKYIQASSPFKVHYPATGLTLYTGGLREATLNLWIYTGTQGNGNTTANGLNVDASIAGASGDRTDEPTRVLKSTAVGNVDNEFVSFDIANIVESYLRQEFQGESVASTSDTNPNTTIWVDYQMIIKINSAEIVQPLFQCLGLDGYTYFEEGVNAQIGNGAMITADTISVVEGEEVFIPVLTGSDVTLVSFYDADGSLISSANYSASSTESYEQIKYPSEVDAASASILYDGVARNITINTLECNKHTPYRVSFLNRFGAIESLWFNGNNTESSSVKAKEYNRITTSTNNGSDYSIGRGSRYKKRLSSNRSMTLNSGFYPEACNSTFEELIDSTKVWIEKDGVILPINIKNSSFNVKTELNDNAINYTINIEYAFNKINNI